MAPDSVVVQRLQDGAAWGQYEGLKPVFQHAIALAREAEHRALATAIQIQQRVDPAYPPLVELLAQCAPREEPPF